MTTGALHHEVSLRQAAVWYAGRYDVAGAKPERNETLKQLLRDRLEQWHTAGAGWVRVTGSGAGKRLHVEREGLRAALETLPRCRAATCNRPALREDGRCGSCGDGRTGRPREVAQAWALRECAGCGRREEAPLYGQQRRWWCDSCNGRERYGPDVQCICEHCGDPFTRPARVVARIGARFCGYSCLALSKWARGILRSSLAAVFADPRRRARWYLKRHKSTAEFGRLAAALAAADGKASGRPGMKRADGSQLTSAELGQVAELLVDAAWSQGRIAIRFGISRDQVKRYAAALKKLGETPLTAV